MRKLISMLVGILVIILVLGLPSVSAQPKSTRVSILSIEDPTYRDFTNRVNFDWVGGYDGVFRMSWSGGYVDLKPKFKYSNSNEYTVDTIKSMFPQVGFTSQIIKGSRWKWGINVSEIPAELLNNVESMVFEVVDYSGIDPSQIRVEGSIIVYKDMYALDWKDVLGDGFTIESISKTRVEIGNIQANIVGGVLFIDPMIQPYPYEDGYLERDEYGVFEVYLTSDPMKVGNDLAIPDNIYRIYMKYNTSKVEFWDTLLNATFYVRVVSESCGAGDSDFWIQNISDYGDLGSSDWDIPYTNISIFYNTSTNSSGWHNTRIDDAIVKGGMTYLRIQGTYEQYGGVDCFLNVNANESAYEPYIEIWYEDGVADNDPPNVTILVPENDTYYDNETVPLEVIGEDANNITSWKYNLNAGGNVTFSPNITITAVNGSNHIIVWAVDQYGNEGFNETYFTFIDNIPNIIIVDPKNQTYLYPFSATVDMTSSELMDAWIYSVNGGANQTFVPNVTIVDFGFGANILNVWANDTTGNWAYNQTVFTVLFYKGNETLDSLRVYYPSYSSVGANTSIFIMPFVDGSVYQHTLVQLTIDNTTTYITFDDDTNSYYAIWIPSANGVYNFTAYAETQANNLSATGQILVADPFCIEVHLWNNETMVAGSEYKNEWAWVYATRVYDPTLRRLFGRDRFECPPQGDTECMWHDGYINGTGEVCLYEEGNYSLYMIGNNIRWEEDIGSGYVRDCEFCEKTEVSKKFFYPLGNYYFDEDEILHLYISPMDRYVFGAFFGIGLSWVGLLISAIIGFIFFMFALKWSGSIKTALAVLILLPTIIYIIMHLALFAG